MGEYRYDVFAWHHISFPIVAIAPWKVGITVVNDNVVTANVER